MLFVNLLKGAAQKIQESPEPSPRDLTDKLKRQNQRLKKEIKMLYQIMIDKEMRILKMKTYIHEKLKLTEYEDDYELLEDEFNKILLEEYSYDPRPNSRHGSEEEDTLEAAKAAEKPAEKAEEPEKAEEQENSENKEEEKGEKQEEGAVIEENNKVAEQGGEGESKPNRLSERTKIEIIKETLAANQEQAENSHQAENNSDESNSSKGAERKAKDRNAFVQKKHNNKIITIKPIEPENVTRSLFSFELELKEYCHPVFEGTKQLLAKPTLSVDFIHDEIERLAEIAAASKYFQTIFPEDTREKVANELETYIFEVLHDKLFHVNEDISGFSQQFRDRLIVLKSIITPALLEIPEPLRDHKLYTFPIKEFEKIGTLKSPLWKLQAVQNSIHHVINVFIEKIQREPNSDELFPILVYIVLHAEVQMLKYNIDYIYNYLRQCNLLGQLGFLAANLKGVMQFLQDLNGTALCQGKLEMKRL